MIGQNNIARRPRNISLKQKPACPSFVEPTDAGDLRKRVPASLARVPATANAQMASYAAWNGSRDRLHHSRKSLVERSGIGYSRSYRTFLSPAEQGYYYTFGSLIALQIVFEPVFRFLILQLATSRTSPFDNLPNGTISGDAVAHARLASVLQRTIRWYSIAALLLAAFLLTGGSHFFSMYHHSGDSVSWHLPWYAAALAATLTFQIDPILSFMEGCGFVANVARLRLAQAATGSMLAWPLSRCIMGCLLPRWLWSAMRVSHSSGFRGGGTCSAHFCGIILVLTRFAGGRRCGRFNGGSLLAGFAAISYSSFTTLSSSHIAGRSLPGKWVCL